MTASPIGIERPDGRKPERVSILIRSLGRPELAQALASVAAQTWPEIEVLVVAVRPDHPPLADRAGPHPVRLVAATAPRPRALAANVALRAASGDWLLFLDDDDWLMPGHVERLLGALRAHPGVLAAYTGVAMTGADGQPLGQAFDLPWDPTRLLAGNLMPIHAVLFSARLRELGCAFDEAMDRYEDWDFWLQVSRHTVMLHLPGVSAAYRIHDSSGVHQTDTASVAAVDAVADKWWPMLTPARRAELMRRAWCHDDALLRAQALQQRLDGSEAAQQRLAALAQSQAADLAALRERVEAQARQAEASARELQALHADASAARQRAEALRFELDACRLDLQALRDSTSWRLTAPLRALMGLLRTR